ncbi:hypothetical protein B0A48_15172 [Cryoendolithus antarcticus]|uniref:Uncharacterized protein n=1 Tax=Cryoendolithus antarcticus TaxID=1507870 RepID=A0A1V8SI61_9PEZI|nr:hypothetical protein B0A48_15172 [Cryoendolithus antarcticus]
MSSNLPAFDSPEQTETSEKAANASSNVSQSFMRRPGRDDLLLGKYQSHILGPIADDTGTIRAARHIVDNTDKNPFN